MSSFPCKLILPNFKLTIKVECLGLYVYSNVYYILKSLSHVQLSATSWTVAYQAPLSIEFPGKGTGVGRHFLLQGIFPSQGSKPGLPHCRQMLYHLSHQGKVKYINFQCSETFVSYGSSGPNFVTRWQVWWLNISNNSFIFSLWNREQTPWRDLVSGTLTPVMVMVITLACHLSLRANSLIWNLRAGQTSKTLPETQGRENKMSIFQIASFDYTVAK